MRDNPRITLKNDRGIRKHPSNKNPNFLLLSYYNCHKNKIVIIWMNLNVRDIVRIINHEFMHAILYNLGLRKACHTLDDLNEYLINKGG